MSCLYYPTSLSYITSKQPMLLEENSRQKKPKNSFSKNDQASRLGLYIKSKKGEDFRLRKEKPLSPLDLKFPVPGDDYSMSVGIHQSSVSSETDNTSLITTSSNQNPRESLSTSNTDYDDLYDVSSDEDASEERDNRQKIEAQNYSKNFQPTTVSKIRAISPATQISLKSANTTAHVSVESHDQTPEFLNNVSFDQKIEASHSYTPNFYIRSDDYGDDWGGGVQLHPDAMATLREISQNHDISFGTFENFRDLTSKRMEIPEMQQIRHQTVEDFHQEKPIISISTHRKSISHPISLDIPSPRRFLAMNLSPGTRHTWHFDSPSSTTAEHFYRSPLSQSAKDYEAIISPAAKENGLSHVGPQKQEVKDLCKSYSKFSHIARSCDEETNDKEFCLSDNISNIKDIELDRTSFWVAIQRSILSRPSSPFENLDDYGPVQGCTINNQISQDNDWPTAFEPKFSCENLVVQKENLESSINLEDLENVFYCAFQHLISHSSNQDTFIQRVPRYEAIQSQRVSFPATHRAQLLGKYQLSEFPLSAKAQLLEYLNADVEITSEDLRRLKRDVEDEAIRQILLATWTFLAVKFLYGGHLFPVSIINYLSSIDTKSSRSYGNQVQILDLGGQEACGWAWHCAGEYPEAMIYTVNLKSLQLSDTKISGPDNHRNLIVDSFVRLPFQDNQFNLISARSLYSILKTQTESGRDEWDACLEECFRVLKPGGYLEFEIIDSEIINPGPLGFAKGSEFSTNLKLLGFDSQPSKTWLARLTRCHFVEIRRTWLFLPMGRCTNHQAKETDSTGVEEKLSQSTTDLAPICGLIGSWAWERWLLRCKMQAGGIGDSFEGIEAIMLEGSKCGAGWNSLNGWARKPFQ